MTRMGVILGTAAYMAPEQAKGRPVDQRSDIWAFGCVLYEMLTGTRAFAGDDASDTLAFVLTKEPDWTALPGDTPTAIRRLLRRCVQKNARARLHDIRDARLEMQDGEAEAASGRTAVPIPAEARRDVRGDRWRMALTVAATTVIAGAVAVPATWWLTRPSPPRVIRTEIATGGTTALNVQGVDRDIAITPDGSRLIYRGNNQLLVRALDQLEPAVLSGLGAARGVFVSPDGQWIGFFDDGIKKVAVTGGPAVTVASIEGGNPRGATWGADGTIVFATFASGTGLLRVSAAGGEPTVLTKPDRDSDHFWPEFLPGGEAVLFTVVPPAGVQDAQVAVLDLRTGASKVLIRGGSHAHYVTPGYLVYSARGTLHAVGFDLQRLEVVGTPAPVVEGVVTGPAGSANFVVSSNGTLAYVRGAGSGAQQTVVSVDREGRASALPGIPSDAYRDVRVSPDGTRLALAARGDIWTYDIPRATMSRLTTDPAGERYPFWTPDGRRIGFTSNRAGYPEIFWRSADGTGSDERLLARGKDLVELAGYGWSADGMKLVFTEVIQGQSRQCVILQVTADGEPTVLVKNEFCNYAGVVSPDGRWLTYASDLSGHTEIYVERYPQSGSRQQISMDGGNFPLWSRDGRTLFFRSLNDRHMLSVAVQSGATFTAGRPEILFELPMAPELAGSRPYDLAPDGTFVVVRSAQTESAGQTPRLVLVQNWTEELKRLVPAR